MPYYVFSMCVLQHWFVSESMQSTTSASTTLSRFYKATSIKLQVTRMLSISLESLDLNLNQVHRRHRLTCKRELDFVCGPSSNTCATFGSSLPSVVFRRHGPLCISKPRMFLGQSSMCVLRVKSFLLLRCQSIWLIEGWDVISSRSGSVYSIRKGRNDAFWQAPPFSKHPALGSLCTGSSFVLTISNLSLFFNYSFHEPNRQPCRSMSVAFVAPSCQHHCHTIISIVSCKSLLNWRVWSFFLVFKLSNSSLSNMTGLSHAPGSWDINSSSTRRRVMVE
jgi:hypothetical protein